VDTSLCISFTIIPCTEAQQSSMWDKYSLCTLLCVVSHTTATTFSLHCW